MGSDGQRLLYPDEYEPTQKKDKSSMMLANDVEDIRELGNTAQKYGGKYGDLYGGQQISQIGFWTNSKPAGCLAMPQK